MSGRRVIGIDVGGTFTDIVLVDEAGGAAAGTVTVSKVPSTRGAEADGFVQGIDTVLEQAGVALSEVDAIVHGTTVGTNALLERKGARCGLITTTGFRDVLEMRRRDRPNTWGLWGEFEPVIARDLRVEVAERTGADGSIVTPVDADAVRTAAEQLLAAGAEACCVAFINAHANSTNERAAVAAVREVWPSPHVTAATELQSEIREFERTSTSAINAYLQPVVGDYLAELERRLAAAGFTGSFLIVQSNGGVMTAAAARARPVRTALSGPAAGVIAARHLAAAAGHDNLITCDMGGTSFDVAVVAAGESVSAPQTAVDFGLVIRTPMIEISTIGAGGGSIAHVDDGGILRVGPESAGSNPGPACYGRGNHRPTVTDAHLALGRLNGEHPIGGLDRLDNAAAEAAIAAHVGEPLGLDVADAAAAVLTVATSRMAGAIRLVSIQRGHDPGRFMAMPFGGAGALHVCGLIEQVGLRGAVIPRHPGVVSAFGATIADTRHEIVQTVGAGIADAVDGGLAARLAAADGELRAFLDTTQLAFDGVGVRHELDMSYVGQTHTVAVPISAAGLTASMVQAAFDDAYRAAYGRVLDSIAARVLSARSMIVGLRPKVDPTVFAPTAAATPDPAPRRAYFGGSWVDAPVYDRAGLPVGWSASGPAIVEQADATVVIEPGFEARVDTFGNLEVTPS